MNIAAWLLVVLVLACGGDGREQQIQGHGTVEVDEADIAPTAAARVVRVWVDEGDSVRTGDTLVTLTQSTVQPDISGRLARVASAEATLRDLEAGARPAEIERAQAELQTAEAEATRTARDFQRIARLAAQDVVSQQQLDAARSAADAARGQRDAAREALRLAREGTRPERIRAARAEVESARAALAMAQAVAADLVLVAPTNGVVLGRYAEPGEVLGAGIPAVTIGELQKPWVRVFIAARKLPRVTLGQAATVRLAGFPERELRGRVATINGEAEFTPRVALTEDERADLVFGVKVEMDDARGALKPGLPATVTIDAPPMPAGSVEQSPVRKHR